ncbi:MAG: DPP IV N-terminal domain-containing protein [Pyrinomonadaceae bacterium]
MNKKRIIIALFMVGVMALTIAAQNLSKENYDQAVKMLGYDFSKYIDHAGVNPVFLEDGTFWYRTTDAGTTQYVLFDPKTGSKKIGANPSELGITVEAMPLRGRFRQTAASPDGTKEVYIKDWNLWVRDLNTKKETQLTKDGVENYGYATDNAGWKHSDAAIVLWSPDSKKVATFKQDQRNVSDMYLVSTNVGEPKLSAWKYPIPEDKEIVKIERVIIDTTNGNLVKLKIPADDHRGTLCDDISCTGAFDDNEWSADSSKLMFVSSSRDHKDAKLRIADANTGAVKEVLEEKVKTQYESGQGTINWKYLYDTNEAIWYSERDDWGHLYLYDLNGKLKNQITKGDWVVTSVAKVDRPNRTIYFYANGREPGEDPYFSHFYSVKFDGSNLKLLTPESGNHRVNLSDDGKYFVDEYSKPDVPPVTNLRSMDGKLIATLEKTDISRLKATGWKPPTPVTVKDRNGKWDLYGLMFTPTNLDTSKKYPVVNYIYPGPQGGGVGSRSFRATRGDHQSLAELGFIVVVIDGTCNPDRSKSFHDACYGDMADNTLPDQIAGLEQLAKKYPFMDLDRVGIWGHSGGGFATASAMFKYPDFYKVGISESGNHDNRNYEDDWGERYIGLINGDNYEKQANQVYAKNLKGKLLIAHGGMDDNVPPYNSYLVVDALIKANKDFDLVIFPNARHGYGSDSLYMMRRRWDYFVKNLLGAEPPKEYEIKLPGR